MKMHLARPLQRFERGDRSHQLHAVVGRRIGRAEKFLFVLARAEDRAPAAGAGIAAAGAVRIGINARPSARARGFGHQSSPYALARVMSRWKRSFWRYSSGSFGFTSAPGGWLSRS